MKKTLAIVSLFVLMAMNAPFVLAADDAPMSVDTKFSTVADLMNFVNRIINWIFTALIITAVIMILISAFGWLTAGGDSAKVDKARQQLIYAVIAIIIGALAKGLVLMVGNLLGVNIRF